MFFPQMRPQVASASQESKVKSQKEESDVEEVQNENEEEAGLTDEEKSVLNILKDCSPMDLNELKGQTGLSNKKRDKAIKGDSAIRSGLIFVTFL